MKPNLNEDTTPLIWDYYFKVRMPYLQTTSESFLRVHGMPFSGDKGIDQQVANSWVTTMASIATMVEHFKNGVMVRVVNEADTKAIYDNISRHLKAWQDRLRVGVNIGDAPIEDLIAMDQFANAVYEHAKYHFSKESLESIFGRDMGNLLGFTPSTFFKPGTMQVGHLPSDRKDVHLSGISSSPTSEIAERESLAGFFKTTMVNLKKWN